MEDSILLELEDYKTQRDMTKTLEKRWVSMFLELVDYKSKNGHADVPARYSISKSLGYWVRRQRLVYTEGNLDPLREKLLKTVGFKFRLMDIHDWDIMFDKLVEFKNQFGHTHITEGYEDIQLHNWLVYQRKLYWKGKLHFDKIEKIKYLGVDMTNKTLNRWEDKFALLVEFKEKHGHLYICKSFGADYQLINFVKGLRRRKDKMSAERKQLLDNIGFIWNPEQTVTAILNKERANQQWLQRVKELKEYKSEYGTCYIPTTSLSHKSLASWISVQRNNVSSLSPEKISILEDIGFFADQNNSLSTNKQK